MEDGADMEGVYVTTGWVEVIVVMIGPCVSTGLVGVCVMTDVIWVTTVVGRGVSGLGAGSYIVDGSTEITDVEGGSVVVVVAGAADVCGIEVVVVVVTASAAVVVVVGTLGSVRAVSGSTVVVTVHGSELGKG